MRRATAALGLGTVLLLPGCVTSRTTGGRAPTRRQQAQLLLEKEPAQAIPLVERLAAESPADLDVARLRAEAWVRAGRADELIASTPGGSAVAHYTRGLALFSRARDARPALEEFRAAVALAPQEAELHHRLGVALLESEQDAEALAPLERAVALFPAHTGWFLPLAKAYHRNGRPRDAVKALRLVVEQAPSPREVKTARELSALIHHPLQGVPRSAVPRLEQALQWLNASDAPQQAIVALEELLLEFPDLGAAHALLGLAFQRLDDAGRAVDEFRRAADLSPEDARPHQYLAILWQGRQRDPSAREALERALERDPLLDDAWMRLGDLSLSRGDTATAHRCFQVLSHLQHDSPGSHSRLALVLQLEGDFAAAGTALDRALELSPDNPDLQLRMGQLFAERSRGARNSQERAAHRAEAERWINKVLEAQPDNAGAAQAIEALRAP